MHSIHRVSVTLNTLGNVHQPVVGDTHSVPRCPLQRTPIKSRAAPWPTWRSCPCISPVGRVCALAPRTRHLLGPWLKPQLRFLLPHHVAGRLMLETDGEREREHMVLANPGCSKCGPPPPDLHPTLRVCPPLLTRLAPHCVVPIDRVTMCSEHCNLVWEPSVL